MSIILSVKCISIGETTYPSTEYICNLLSLITCIICTIFISYIMPCILPKQIFALCFRIHLTFVCCRTASRNLLGQIHNKVGDESERSSTTISSVLLFSLHSCPFSCFAALRSIDWLGSIRDCSKAVSWWKQQNLQLLIRYTSTERSLLFSLISIRSPSVIRSL